ncbi:MAG: hypothetical protein ACQES8_04650 [Thermodesulfobacteriota bacterium]
MEENRREIIVIDIRMPFMSMVVFMIKWAIAAIPALVILSILLGVMSLILGGFTTGFMGSMYHHMGRGI